MRRIAAGYQQGGGRRHRYRRGLLPVSGHWRRVLDDAAGEASGASFAVAERTRDGDPAEGRPRLRPSAEGLSPEVLRIDPLPFIPRPFGPFLSIPPQIAAAGQTGFKVITECRVLTTPRRNQFFRRLGGVSGRDVPSRRTRDQDCGCTLHCWGVGAGQLNRRVLASFDSTAASVLRFIDRREQCTTCRNTVGRCIGPIGLR